MFFSVTNRKPTQNNKLNKINIFSVTVNQVLHNGNVSEGLAL